MCVKSLVITDYFKYRCTLRSFDLAQLETVVRYSSERYYDTETQRHIIIGDSGGKLVMIAYEEDAQTITPVTVHAINRQQIRFRLTTGRFIYE